MYKLLLHGNSCDMLLNCVQHIMTNPQQTHSLQEALNHNVCTKEDDPSVPECQHNLVCLRADLDQRG
jgi:hypothetical protein